MVLVVLASTKSILNIRAFFEERYDGGLKLNLVFKFICIFFRENRIEQSSQQPNSRLQVYPKKVDPKEEGTVVELTQFETGNGQLLF